MSRCSSRLGSQRNKKIDEEASIKGLVFLYIELLLSRLRECMDVWESGRGGG